MSKKHVYIEYVDSSAEVFSEVTISWGQQDQALVVTHEDEHNGYSWIPYGFVKRVWVQDNPIWFEEEEE